MGDAKIAGMRIWCQFGNFFDPTVFRSRCQIGRRLACGNIAIAFLRPFRLNLQCGCLTLPTAVSTKANRSLTLWRQGNADAMGVFALKGTNGQERPETRPKSRKISQIKESNSSNFFPEGFNRRLGVGSS